MDCEACSLIKECTSPVEMFVGENYKGLLIVGEAPGISEDKKGVPFVGKSGRILREVLADAGLKRSEVAISNVAHCFPRYTKTPDKEQVDTCTKLWLLDEIELLDPIVILALGAIAAKFFACDDKLKITKANGSVVVWKHPKTEKEYPVVLGVHPAYILRNMDEINMLCVATKKAAGLLSGEDKKLDFTICDVTEERLEDMGFLFDPMVEVYADFETTGLKTYSDRADIVSFAFMPDKIDGGQNDTVVYYILWHHGEGGGLKETLLGDLFLNLLHDSTCGWCFHNAKFDSQFAMKFWNWRPRVVFDTRLAYAIKSEQSAGLKNIAWEMTDYGGYEEVLGGWDMKNDMGAFNCPKEELRLYNCADVFVMKIIRDRFKHR